MAQKIGEIDLDTLKAQYSVEMFNRKVERMQKVVSGADKQMSSWQRTWNGLARVAGAFGVALGAGAIVNYIASIRNLNKEINETRSGLVRGSQEAADFNAAVGGGSDEQAAKINKVTMAVDRARLSVKKFVANWLEQIGDGQTQKGSWLDQIADYFTPAADKAAMSLSAPTLGGEGPKDTYAEILAIEDRIAALNATKTNDMKAQLELIAEQVRLEQKKAEYAEATNDPNKRTQIAQAQAAEREAVLSAQALVQARNLENREAQNKLEIQAEEIAGYKKIGEQYGIISSYQEKFTKAIKEGNVELANALMLMRDRDLAKAQVEEHKMTPRERLKERQSAREFEADKKKTDAAQKEMQSRIDRGIKGGKGSELERFQRGQEIIGGRRRAPFGQGDVDRVNKAMAQDIHSILEVLKE